jgi:hypothetical protein
VGDRLVVREGGLLDGVEVVGSRAEVLQCASGRDASTWVASARASRMAKRYIDQVSSHAQQR